MNKMPIFWLNSLTVNLTQFVRKRITNCNETLLIYTTNLLTLLKKNLKCWIIFFENGFDFDETEVSN